MHASKNVGFMIAGSHSGSGKTTITMGLSALFKARGKKVASFKAGPDFIDPHFHTEASGFISHNLDSYLLRTKTIQYLYTRYSDSKDISIVESAMGLYDGMGPKAKGSGAELAQILNLPVVLILDVSSMSQSVLAIIHGFSSLNKNIKIIGCILNKVGGQNHFSLLSNLIHKNLAIPCFGYAEYEQDFCLHSRHLGLVQSVEVNNISLKINLLAKALEKTIDVDLLEKTINAAYAILQKKRAGGKSLVDGQQKSSLATKNIMTNFTKPKLAGLRLAIAWDAAFQFYYSANLDLLASDGAKLYPFSPLYDNKLPDTTNAVYIGGGYPEIFAPQLYKNKKLLAELKHKIELGMPTYGECGGLMCLSKSITPLASGATALPMVSVFNCKIIMTKYLQNFGYGTITYKGIQVRCHEFHTSVMKDAVKPNYARAYKVCDGESNRLRSWGIQRMNCLAGYAHIHFYSSQRYYNLLCSLWLGGYKNIM